MAVTLSERERNRRKQARHRSRPTATRRDKIERQNIVLTQTALGVPEVEICAELGITPSTIYQWRTREPLFKARHEAAKNKARYGFEPSRVPYDADFVKTYFGFDTPAHLKEIRAGILEMEALAETSREPKAILILSHPDSAKSTEIENYLSHGIATDPNIRCVLISKTLGAARKRTGRIQRRLTDRARYPDFIDSFGPFKSESRVDARPWRSDFFTVIGQDSGERDYTLEALGIGGQIYGTRAERIVLDDIADLGNQTPAEIEKQLEYIQVEVISRLVENGVLIVIGTHMREQDVYIRLEELGIFDKVIRLPAIETDEDGNESPLWPERYPLKRLHSIKAKRDARIWELVWMQNPLPKVGSVFTMEMFEDNYDEDRYIGHVPEGSIVIAGVDPSVSNFTAGVVFALKQTDSGEWYRYLVDVRNEAGLTGEGNDNHRGVVDFIVNLCADYRVTTLCVEDGAWMSLINNSFTLHSKLYDLGVNHIPIKATETSTGSEAIRALSGLFTHRLINLPGSPKSKQQLGVMVNQFLTWRDEKQHWRKQFDILKAFRMAEHAVQMTVNRSKGHYRERAASSDIPDWMLASA